MDLEVQEDKLEIEIIEEIEQVREIFYKFSVDSVPAKQLAQEYNVSLKTIYNKIEKARKLFHDEIEEVGDKLRADIWNKYKKAESMLWELWVATPANLDYLIQLRGIWSDQRKMLSLDKPSRLPVDNKGEVQQNVQFMVIMSPDKYETKEKQYQLDKEVPIEGEFKELPKEE